MLSIVVCTRNRSEMLARCLHALIQQPGNFEVLVIDQGNTPASIPNDPRIRRIADSNRGLAAARNTGIRAASGSIIAFVDDDAVPAAGYLPAVERAFQDDARLMAAAGRIQALEDGTPYSRVHDSVYRILGRRDWIYFMGGNFAVRRDVMYDIGLFDERFGAGRRWASAEETDFFFRMLYRKYRVAYVPAAIVRHPREPVECASNDLRAKLLGYGRGQGAMMARHFVDFSNYRMFGALIWTVIKPCLRAIQYTLLLRPRQAMLHAVIALGKFTGFAEFAQMASR